MGDVTGTKAWLEKPGGETVPVGGNVSFGRTAGNAVVLADERVSRRHALIHPQGEEEFWLVDLGSRNGTYVNQRRLSQPLRLRDGDRIQVGPFSLTFRQPRTASAGLPAQPTTLQTLLEVRTLCCWLLVVDVEGSTDLAKSLSAEELARVMGRWFSQCKHAIETHGGTINKYLGDGLLAYWRAADGDIPALAQTIESLARLRQAGPPSFRFALHRGTVTFGGVASLGEESLSGPEVNFAFRMEKLAGSLAAPALLSEAAATALRGAVELTPLGDHLLPGFEGPHRFFAC